MTASAPMISVVTPSYNQGGFVERCIRSVIAQDYPNFEHIVYDNCSTDGTIDTLARHPHLDWTSEPDTGQSDALNKAIRKSRGEIIAWINADDAYEPGAFDVAARELQRDTGVKAIAGRVRLVDADDKVSETSTPRFEGLNYLLEFWRGGYGLCQPGVFFRRELIGELGFLREDLHFAMDYDFWLRVAQRYPFKVIDRVFARYVVHPQSKSGRAVYGSGFNEELERVSRQYWGPRATLRHWRLARGCNRFFADCCSNAIVHAHKTRDRFDWPTFRRMVRRRPASLFGRHLLAVACERIVGASAWSAMRRLAGRHDPPMSRDAEETA